MKYPIVTIVGRPNTGKSTLFNRLAGERKAIESPEAGTTRDRISAKIEHRELDFLLVDTGGLEFGKADSSIESDVRLQAKIGIEEADVILFVIEGNGSLMAEDLKVADFLRKSAQKKPILLIANKCDRPLGEGELANLYQLGLGDPLPISALHNQGTQEIMERVIGLLKKRHFLVKGSDGWNEAVKQEAAQDLVALVGKPNVGKSSLINALLGQNKLIVSPVPGTTRDAVDSLIQHEGALYNFIDTAGLRKKSKWEGIEYYSALRSLEAIGRSNVVMLVLDSSETPGHQDQQIVHEVLAAGKGLILLANKWDLEKEEGEKEEKRREAYIRRLQSKFPFIPWAPVIFTSAVTKKNLRALFAQINIVRAERQKRIPTGSLNRFFAQVIAEHHPTGTKSVRPKLYYLTQAGVNPPHFVLFVNRKDAFHFSYVRYMENRLREKFGFTGTPVRLTFEEKPRRGIGDTKRKSRRR